jgi:hypothetical protein
MPALGIKSTFSSVVNMENYKPLDYFEIAAIEGLNPNQLMHGQNRYQNINAPASDNFRVPAISHHIWFTKPSAPSEMREQDFTSYTRLLSVLGSNGTDWQHFLWTNCKSCIPETLKKFHNTNVIVREISDASDKLVSSAIVTNLIDKKQFGIAADFFRFDLLKTFGGFYSDLNYIMNYSPDEHMRSFDFFAHTDRGGVFIDVYMIAAKPHHPILEEAVTTVLRNFINPPAYVVSAGNSSMHIQEYTGVMTYLPFNFAFFKNLNHNTTDFIFPLETLNKYPMDAKQYMNTCEYIDYFRTSECTDGICDTNQQILTFLDYCSKEICMEEILGFDSADGNSWFDSAPLYND